jgi:hypothetical protein
LSRSRDKRETVAEPEQFSLFARLGRALFGSHWQSELARTIDVNLRTVRRWGTGQEEPPAGVRHELEKSRSNTAPSSSF